MYSILKSYGVSERVIHHITSLSLTCHLIPRVDNLLQLLGQFVDLKFRPEMQVIADLFFSLLVFYPEKYGSLKI